MPDSTVSRTVKLVNEKGFHIRPAHLVMKMAAEFKSDIKIINENHAVDGKSMLDLLTLIAPNGTTLTLQARGTDAQAAVDALAQLVAAGFGEMDEPQ
jgi:phosphotransferase system HPr (HPr) family protein